MTFRDRHPFETLKQSILPKLIEQRSQVRSLHIWSAACSYRREPYSIAILLREHFPMLKDWTIRIIASDFSTKVLERAKQGRYGQLEISRGLSPLLRQKYFHKQPEGWQINPKIRQSVESYPINLIRPWPMLPAMDVIFLRNVLIYFDLETKRRVLQHIRQQLRSEGYLFLGGGETTFNVDDRFEPLYVDRSICHRLRSTSTKSPRSTRSRAWDLPNITDLLKGELLRLLKHLYSLARGNS